MEILRAWISFSAGDNESVKTSLLLSNVIDADHQTSCLFTNKGHFSSPLRGLIGVIAKFHE